MEEQIENHDQRIQNIQIEQLILQQKREKINLFNKLNQLEKQNKVLNSEVEQYKSETNDQAIKIKQLKDFIKRQELVQRLLNFIRANCSNQFQKKFINHIIELQFSLYIDQSKKNLVNKEQQRSQNHENSLSVPQTEMKPNKYYSNQSLKSKKSEQQSLEDYLAIEKTELGDYRQQSRKQQQINDQINRLSSIVEENNKMVVVQVQKSKLKKLSSQQIQELLNKE